MERPIATIHEPRIAGLLVRLRHHIQRHQFLTRHAVCSLLLVGILDCPRARKGALQPEVVLVRSFAMASRALFIALLFVLGCEASPAQTAVAIPRYVGPTDTAAPPYIRDMNYDPTDWVIAWPKRDTLVVAHVDHYSSADVSVPTCGGSGVFVIPLGGGAAHSLGAGEPVCRLVVGNGITLGSSGDFAFASLDVPVNESRLVRLRLPDAHLDTLRTTCIYAEDPDVSVDGAHLVFRGLCEGRQQEHWELYTVDSDGAGLRRLPQDSGYDAEAPRWSADGQRIAYVRTRESAQDRVDEIVIIDASGRRVVARGSSPAWSPDGSSIAYVRADSDRALPASIHVVNQDGTGDHEIFRNSERSTYSRGWGPMLEGQPGGRLMWSPDGQWIAFSRRYDRGASVWRVEVKTGAARPVTRSDR